MVKQVIVVNKGLNMSKGKASAQVAHGSMAFITNLLRQREVCFNEGGERQTVIPQMSDSLIAWIDGEFAKIVLCVENEEALQEVVNKALEEAFVERRDFFCIRDNCHTELTPDETGTRWTCIGFAPMEAEKIDKVTRHLKLYK